MDIYDNIFDFSDDKKKEIFEGIVLDPNISLDGTDRG